MTLSLTRQFNVKLVLALSEDSKKSLSAKLGDSSVSSMSDDELRNFLSPRPEDYVMIPMRALSADSVQGNTINFAHNGGQALKNAVGLFDGLIVLKDHNQTVDSWVGKTQDAYWDTSIPNTPPGVNFMLKIDTKADPKLARGLLSGMLESGSVTIGFDHEKSHPKMKDFDFYMALGDTVDGKVVQALVTNITRCYEYSIVWQGADTNAKTINRDGTINRPGLSQTPPEVPMKKLAALLSLAETATEDEIAVALTSRQATQSAAETAKATAEATVATLTATVASKDVEITAKTSDVATLTSQVATLTAEKLASTSEITTLKADQAKFAAHLEKRRAEAERLYVLSEGDKALEPMKLMMKHADLEAAESFITTFGAQADKLYPMACTKCNSTTLSRRTSKESSSHEDNKDTKVDTVQLAAAKATVHNIHG